MKIFTGRLCYFARSLKVVFGVLFVVAFGIGPAISALSLSFGSSRTEGTVVKLEESRGDNSKNMRFPVVEYRVAGRTYSYRGVGSSSGRYTVGDKVPIIYKVKQPGAASIDSFFDRWLIPSAFSGAGLLFAAIGIFIVRKRRPCTA